MFTGIKALVDADLEGRTNTYSFRKNPSQVTAQWLWFDLALSPWNPVPKYWFWTPLQSTIISQSLDGWFYHGSGTQSKYLLKTTITATVATALPLTLTMLDYLMYYPLIDEGTTDEQFMVNSTPLPRYTDGKWVKIMAVSVAGRTGGSQFFVNYTNSDWVSGRISKTVTENNNAALGVIVTSAVNTNGATCLYIPLQDWDTGVRSIESVTMLTPDVWLFSLVLVRPLCNTDVRTIDAPVEMNYVRDSNVIPEIKPDAFLNFVCIPNWTLNSTWLLIDMKVAW
jgi:cyclophilin family peptidyl-prolyl cis-trans isomerase